MDLPTVGLLEQLTVAQAERHCRVLVSTPLKLHLCHTTKLPLWEVFCSAWAGCEAPAAWTHIPPPTLLSCKEQQALCAGEWECAGWKKRGANSRSEPLSFLFSVCLYLDSRHSPDAVCQLLTATGAAQVFSCALADLTCTPTAFAWAICRLIFTKSALWSPYLCPTLLFSLSFLFQLRYPAAWQIRHCQITKDLTNILNFLT